MVRQLLALGLLAGCTGRAEPSYPPGADLAAQVVRVVFADEIERQVRQRTWDSETDVWSDPSPVLDTTDPVSWVVLERSKTSEEEMVAAYEANSGSASLRVGRRADSWLNEWTEPTLAQQSRGFDLAYENESGDALVVFATAPGGLSYRRRRGDTWSASAPVAASTGSGVHWVVLESRPASDEIALVYLTADVRLEAILWDGDDWDTASATTLENGELAALERTRPFDVAYEDLSGDLMVLWGHIDDPENLVRYALKPADTVDWPVVEDDGSVTMQIAALASEAGSDRIASVGTEGYGDDDYGGMIWDGDTWGHRIERIDDSGSNEDHVVAGAWLGAQGSFASIYEDRHPTTGSINWSTWSATGWELEEDLPLPGGAEMVAVEMHTLRGIYGAMALVSTPGSTMGEGARLYAVTISLGTIGYTNGGAPIVASMPGVPGQPFDMVGW